MTKVTYSRAGDYLLPNLTLNIPPEMEQLDRYGMLRRDYLKERRRILYNALLLKGTLHQHLIEIQQGARKRMALLMKKMEESYQPLEKNRDPIRWAREMNTRRSQAEEVVLRELIYN